MQNRALIQDLGILTAQMQDLRKQIEGGAAVQGGAAEAGRPRFHSTHRRLTIGAEAELTSAASLLRAMRPIAFFGLIWTGLISHAVEHAKGPYWLGIFLVVLIVPPMTFSLHSLWTYRH
jgi:hypothetical protein